MSETRLNKVEDKIERFEKVFYKVEASLENIEKTLDNAMAIRDKVTTHEEKHKITEARLENLEKKDAEIDKGINNLNLKIAVASGIWMALIFFAKELLFK